TKSHEDEYRSFVRLRVASWAPSVNQSFGNVLICVNAPVAQKRPVRALNVELPEIHFGHQDLLFADAAFRDELPRRVGDKALAPKLDSLTRMAIGRGFVADAVGDGDVHAVGDGVRALNRFPGGMLPFAVFSFFRRLPADGRWVKQN